MSQHELHRIGRPQRVDSDGVPTRERVVRAAQEAIIANGYDAATLAEIAKAAGVSPPAIYNHFGSKSELFVEAARHALGPASFELREPHDLLRIDAPESIRKYRRLLVELHTAGLRHPDLAEALREWQDVHVERWVAAGIGSEATARSYYVLVQGLALMDVLNIDPADGDVAAFIHRMGDVLLQAN